MAETTYLLPHCIDGENVSECLTCLEHLQTVVSHLPAYGLTLVGININPTEVTITVSDAISEDQLEHLNLTVVE